jgi:putative addiction module component (TIGR02574 family)
MADTGGPTMPATKAEILELAKALPFDEQWELVEELGAALQPHVTDEQFHEELERRWQQHLADPSQARPGEEVIEAIRQKYRHG